MNRQLVVLLLAVGLAVMAAFIALKLYEAIGEHQTNRCLIGYLLALNQSHNRERFCPR